MNAHTVNICSYQSPCGELLLGENYGRLCLCDWKSIKHRGRNDNRIMRFLNAEYVERKSDVLVRAAKELDEYFAGMRKEFDIPLLFAGTEFQRSVWNALYGIPYGETRSYMEIARQVGNPKGVRAVAQAVGANAISILVPCHRVIGSDFSLTGFAGGLETKRFLLELEKSMP